MADLNPSHNAAAPEILAALKALDADLRIARSQLANLERQVAGTAAPRAGGGIQPRSEATVRKATAALEEENVVAQRGLNIELQRLEAINAQAASHGKVIQASPGYRQSGAVAGGRGGLLVAEEAAYAENEARRIAASKAARDQIIIPRRNAGPNVGQQTLQEEKILAAERAQAEVLTLQETKQRALAAVERARVGTLERQVALEREGEQFRARQVIQEREATHAIEQQVAWMERLAQIQRTAATLPAGIRQQFVQSAAAQPLYTGAPGTHPQLTQAPYTRSQVGGAVAGSFRADEAQRLEATRARVRALSVTEGEYVASTRQASAMSGEFLTRLASGQATLGEFGSNLAQTAGKFAGWTAAAAGVGALLGVVTHLFHGARDSSAGVDQLARSIDDVHPERAQAGFRNVSRELNVSIKEVSDAQFQFSRTFNNQNDSLTAARVGLLAYKLDNVNLADSVRALTSLHNQFGVSASQLPGIFDQLDEGQRKFNARVGESLPALNRSSAAVKNAGGDLQELLKIIVYGVRVSGQTGSVIGNALARSASNFVPKNAKDLRALGLDPTQGYTELLIDAISKAGASSGEWRRKAAKALGGPQLGSRVFEPLLGASNLFPDIQHGIDPAHSAGAAQFELQNKLKQTDEELKKVGNSLLRIGSSLAESGAFSGLGAALKLINLMLGGVGKLVDYFNTIPDSIRPWVVGLLEVKGILAILQRTRLGAGLADSTGVGFLGPNAQRRAVKQQVGGLQTSAGAYETQAASTQAAGRAAAQEAAIHQEAASAQRRAGLYTEAAASEAEANVALKRSAVLEETAVRLRGEALAQRAEILALQRGETAVDTEILAAQEAAIAARTTGNVAGAVGAAGAAGGVAAGAAAVEAETAALGATAAAQGGAIAQKAGAIRAGVGQVATAGKRFAGNLLSFGNNMGLMTKALTAFIVGQIFFDHLNRDIESIAKQSADLAKGQQDIQGVNANRKQAGAGHSLPFASRVYDLPFEAASTALGAVSSPGGGYLGFESMQQTVDAQANAQKKLDANILRVRAHTAPGTKQAKWQEVGRSYAELLKQQEDNAKEFADGHITLSEYKKRSDALNRSLLSSLDVLTGDGKGLKAAQEAQRRAYQQGFERAGARKGDPFSQFEHGSLTDNVDFLDLLNTRQKVTGTKAGDFTTITRGIAYIQNKYGGTQDKKQLQQIAQAYQALDTFITQQGDEFKVILDQVRRTGSNLPASAITPGVVVSQFNLQSSRTHSAYQGYIDKLQKEHDSLPTRLKELRKPLNADQRALANAERKLRDEHGLTQGQGDLPLGPIGNLTSQLGTLAPPRTPNLIPDDALIQHIKALKAKVAKDKKRLADSGKALSKRDQKILAEIAQQEEAQYQSDSSALDLRSQYAQATATDQTDAIAQKIKFDGEQVKLAMRYHGPDKWAKITQTLITTAQDIAAQASQHLQDVQLSGDLSTSRIRGSGPKADRARLESQLATARSVLAAAQSEKANPGKKDAILNAQIKVNDLLNQIDASAQQDAQNAHALAEALYQSEIAIKLARAGDDPLKRDRITLQGDQHALRSIKRSDFKSTAEYQTARNNALAKVITDRHQITTDTANQDLQDAQFQHEIGKLTDDQYIKRLKDILKLKGIGKQMRQNLLLEIYRQEHANDGNLELNVGNIKLPSTYEIVRGLRSKAGALTSRPQQHGLVQMTNHNQFNFHINGGKKEEVAAAIGDALAVVTGGSAVANLRAAGHI